MIVVADSGPLHYLILLEHVDLLRRFYGQVLLPEAVASELSAVGAPGIVREWIARPPTWVDVRPIAPEVVATITDDLDLGERARHNAKSQGAERALSACAGLSMCICECAQSHCTGSRVSRLDQASVAV